MALLNSLEWILYLRSLYADGLIIGGFEEVGSGGMRLTDEQRMVVASDSEALRVVAFAGAGKTSTLRVKQRAKLSRFLG